MTDDADTVVSSDSEQLIIVDSDDVEIGNLSKSQCHDGSGTLHRAFSIFLFNSEGELLLQRRAAGKRLWPGYWSNSCCSHPRKGESMAEATTRRLRQELGIRASIEFVYKFSYQAQYDASGAEHELCWVFLGVSDEKPKANSNEIAATKYLSAAGVQQELTTNADAYTPWFRLEWRELSESFAERLAVYTRRTANS